MDYTQTAEDARRLLRGFAAVESLAKAFDEAGQLEQTITTNKVAAGAAQAELASLRERVAQENAVLAAVREQVAAKEVAAKAEADRIVAAAHAEAKAAIIAAEASVLEVQELERTATSNAEAAAAAALDQRDKLLAEVTELEQRAEKARAYLTKLAA